ncbi:MAG TPA: SDR family oxidoreductase [Longimicrobiales bacterium]|nr:SDR family oxidoreductase [Longimicrobiales bacterium]
MVDLSGKSAIVTGATRGIGRAIAEALVGAGAGVVISARTAADVSRVAGELSARGPGQARGIAADVGRFEDCSRMVAGAVEAFGRLDILVNNAGIGVFAPVPDMAVDDWDRVIRTNLDSLFYCSHEAIPHLRRAGGGWILNIGSLAGKNAFPGGSAYNASKFGLVGFSEALMQDVRHDGIRVSYIMPGSVATEFGLSRQGHGDEWKIQPEDIGQMVLDLLALPARTLPSRIEVRPSRPPK